MWEDQSVWNVDFLPVFDNLTAQDLNKLERQFLALLQYNVSLTASLYAKYYFELRTFSKLDSTHFPLQPLDKLNAKRLEVFATVPGTNSILILFIFNFAGSFAGFGVSCEDIQAQCKC